MLRSVTELRVQEDCTDAVHLLGSHHLPPAGAGINTRNQVVSWQEGAASGSRLRFDDGRESGSGPSPGEAGGRRSRGPAGALGPRSSRRCGTGRRTTGTQSAPAAQSDPPSEPDQTSRHSLAALDQHQSMPPQRKQRPARQGVARIPEGGRYRKDVEDEKDLDLPVRELQDVLRLAVEQILHVPEPFHKVSVERLQTIRQSPLLAPTLSNGRASPTTRERARAGTHEAFVSKTARQRARVMAKSCCWGRAGSAHHLQEMHVLLHVRQPLWPRVQPRELLLLQVATVFRRSHHILRPATIPSGPESPQGNQPGSSRGGSKTRAQGQ
eukprot:440782-Rhodomonas_salina.2